MSAWVRCAWGTWARCYQHRTTCRTAHWTAHLDTIGRQLPSRQCRIG